MSQNKPARMDSSGRAGRLPQRFGELLHRLISSAHQSIARIDFLASACATILEFSGCDALELRFTEKGRSHRAKWRVEADGSMRCDTGAGFAPDAPLAAQEPLLIPEPILQGLLYGDLTVAAPFLTRNGSFWIS